MPIIGKPLLVLGSLAGVSLISVGGYFGASALDSQTSQQSTLPETNNSQDLPNPGNQNPLENSNSTQQEEVTVGSQVSIDPSPGAEGSESSDDQSRSAPQVQPPEDASNSRENDEKETPSVSSEGIKSSFEVTDDPTSQKDSVGSNGTVDGAENGGVTKTQEKETNREAGRLSSTEPQPQIVEPGATSSDSLTPQNVGSRSGEEGPASLSGSTGDSVGTSSGVGSQPISPEETPSGTSGQSQASGSLNTQ